MKKSQRRQSPAEWYLFEIRCPHCRRVFYTRLPRAKYNLKLKPQNSKRRKP